MVKRVERVVFDWEKNYESKPQTEPPLPMTKVSRDRVRTRSDDGLDHPLILKAREKRPSLARVRSYITELFQTRITMYDGAMGTMIQKHKLDEPDFRAERFKDYDMLIKGNNDLLSITQPHIIRDIYKKYLRAPAREARDEVTAMDPTKPRFVCGAIGPTNRTASISPDVNDPTTRNCDFDELVEAYYEQRVGLADGGCDIFIIETIFDTLNAKAACFAVNEFLEHTGIDIPLFISGTLVDQSGRTLSGQTGEAFYVSIRHAREAHAIWEACKDFKPRALPTTLGPPRMWLSGLEDFKFDETTYNHTGLPFVNVGERCNIAGSRKFKRLIMEGKYPELMDIAKDQKFVKMAVTEPDVAKAPFMIDSSKFDIVGEELFVKHATRLLRKHGAAVVVMAFDEYGQAATKEDKDIIFDPNILTIGTGIEEHNAYGIDFITAVRQIKEICPWCKISGGVSNLSFGFAASTRSATSRSYITELFQTRITMYDGAMGTMIQKHKLDEPDFRAERFKDYDMLIKGNNDLLSITQPHIIRDIYKKYLVEGGSQLIGTNTFSSTTIAQADYKMEDLVYELNYDSGARARRARRERATLSGQTGEAFYVSIRHAKPMCVGLNCALGAKAMAPFLKRLSDCAECFVHAIWEACKDFKPRARSQQRPPARMWLSGLEDLKIDENTYNNCGLPFVNVEAGAHVVDINVDDGMLDGMAAMQKFVKMAVTEPDVAKAPFMIDSSKFDIVEAGLKWCQGKCIVNSISLKVGEELFVKHATLLRKHGAAIVVMAFDEQGQAATKEDKVRICKRSYDILVNEPVCFPPEDIIFDPNILTIGTGIEEHNAYGIDFITAVRQIKEICPWCKISGGVSNLSFGFRGVNQIRESIHAVFLHHAAVMSGMDMGIVNAAEMLAMQDVEEDLLEMCTDAVLNRTDTATEQLTEMSQWFFDCKQAKKDGTPPPRRPRHCKKQPRKVFSWERDFVPTPQTEPPLPMTKVSRDHVPNPAYDGLDHPLILKAREKRPSLAVSQFDDLRASWAQPKDTHPEGFPYFVRGRDSKHKLDEPDFRAERFKDYDMLIKGNNDLLSITQPHIIRDIYKKYLVEGGSQLIGTNTFSSTTIAQADYKMEDLVYELNYDSARLAREACDEVTAMDRRSRGSASASPDGGCDIFIIEAIFDTLNAKAACFAVNEFLEHTGIDIPLFISGTLVDQSGRTLSGQTGEAFHVSIRHAKPMCVGLNCALGAKAMAPFLKRLSDCAECFVHVYSNARASPNAMGGYDDTPADMAGENVVFAESGWVNMIGGCCGSTPPHIKAIWEEACKDFKPRALPTLGCPRLWLSGLEDFRHDERRRGRRAVIDINVDDGMLDGLAAMQKFVKMAVTEPDVAKRPFMIDSSKFDIVEAGLKWCQGKCIVNSISLKVGEELFVKHATLLRKHGAAVVVMAFDEYGQAASKEDKSGMDMGIVNAAEMLAINEVPPQLREGLRGRGAQPAPDATERLLQATEAEKEAAEARKNGGAVAVAKKTTWRDLPIGERLARVGHQVARVMKKAVAHLLPFMEAEKREKLIAEGKDPDAQDDDSAYAGKFLIATVYDIGVMCTCEAILDAAEKYQVDAIGLSGLITPSLDEMVDVAKEMSARLQASEKPDYVADISDEYAELRDEYYASLEDRKFLDLPKAKSKKQAMLADIVTRKRLVLRGCYGMYAANQSADGEDVDVCKIMMQALADRLVEAFAEALHKDMRVKHWGYADAENLSPEELLKVNPKGPVTAFGGIARKKSAIWRKL
ncbi:betaine-homocysteine S-methyltransferase [Aureococcus anophagefferens]|uniref:methionine synthase n=1 Tax=Aureococcus anophagefferens TaxID=44056 RepID=A0ABR1G5U5_AURAN